MWTQGKQTIVKSRDFSIGSRVEGAADLAVHQFNLLFINHLTQIK